MMKEFDDKKGLCIIIDDINGLSETPEFANWYKSFADRLATSIDNPRLCFMLTGCPDKYNKLYEQNPSFTCIFHVHELKGLSDREVKDFYIDIFNSYDINVDENALNNMSIY